MGMRKVGLAAAVLVFGMASWAADAPKDTRFLPPNPRDFADHQGFVSLFDGTTLNGWDGDRRFWRVEKGAIVGESTPTNPSGNSYITYRGLTAHDFDLKLEIKVEKGGGTGVQYRSRTGLPWHSKTPPEVLANAGPYDPAKMLTGPQADFWFPENPHVLKFSGQAYAENSPMGIEAWLGQVVRQSGDDYAKKRLVGTIAPPEALTGYIKINDWNEYEIIARGGVFLHIINGQLTAVLIDDDPNSINQLPGLFGLEIEGITKVSARNIYVKKLN
jgi:hypothetical protein